VAAGAVGTGVLSIYRRGRDKAWVRGVAGVEGDVFLDGETKRNRALEGDVVAVDLTQRLPYAYGKR